MGQDVLFSGHTAMGTMWTIFSMRYLRKAPWFEITLKWRWSRIFIHVFGWLWLMYGWFVISASHFHYTIDVLVGALLTFAVYIFYHSLICTIWLKQTRPFETPATLFFRWFEVHSFDLKLWRMRMKNLMGDRIRDQGWVSLGPVADEERSSELLDATHIEVRSAHV